MKLTTDNIVSKLVAFLSLLASIVTIVSYQMNSLNFELTVMLVEYYSFEIISVFSISLIYFVSPKRIIIKNKNQKLALIALIFLTIANVFSYEYKKLYIARYTLGPYGVYLLEEKRKYKLASDYAHKLTEEKRWRWQYPYLLSESRRMLQMEETSKKFKEVFSKEVQKSNKYLIHERAVVGRFFDEKEPLYRLYY